jgi:hypothetical protein
MRQVIGLIIVVMLFVVSKGKNDVFVPKKIVLSNPTPVEQFMDKIAEIETPGGGYQTVNKYGMMGRYQFSPNTVKVLGFNVSRSEFLQNKEIQDSVMVAYMRANEQTLHSIIRQYEGKIIKGIKITRASILAGAHFAGSNGVVKFLTNNNHTGTVDGFGTSLRTYMARFSNFHLPPLRG